MDKYFEKWQSRISEVTVGAPPRKTVKVGGEGALPFLYEEGAIPNAPKVALEIFDAAPENWPTPLKKCWEDVYNDPVLWAKKCEEFGAEMLCVRLTGAHPEGKNREAKEVADTVAKIASATSLPMIVVGCGVMQKDLEVLPAVSSSLKGTNALLGIATKEIYKTLVACASADGHSLISEAPLDINLAKQLNILITDSGFPSDRLVLHQTTGALGYGYEYCYTIMERTRLAGLSGDKMMSMPMINFVGLECWKLKEAITPNEDAPHWGEFDERGVIWEVTTASGYLQGGADILVVYHPESLKAIKRTVSELSQK